MKIPPQESPEENWTSFVPEFAVLDHIRKGDLVRLDISDMGIELYSYFIYSKDRWINPVMKEFIRIAEECLQTGILKEMV